VSTKKLQKSAGAGAIHAGKTAAQKIQISDRPTAAPVLVGQVMMHRDGTL